LPTGLLATGYTLRAIGKTPMKMRASRIERMLEKVEATLVPPPRKWLSAIVHEGDDEAVVKEKKEKALVASHPEDAGRTVQDFKWIVWMFF
jgi:hypothetical protein